MNLIDRAFEYLAPVAAVRRAMARDALNTHRGGLSTRTSTPWGRSNTRTGGTMAGRGNQASRADRAMRIYTEHAIGRSLLKTEVDNVVSSGFTLQVKTDNKNFNAEAEDRWPEFLEQADIRGMLCGVDLVRQFYKSPRRDGDGGIVLVDRGGESKLQYIPRQLISSPNGKIAPNMIDGIEVDAACRPQAFHILSESEWGKRDWTRVPAANFIYLAPEIDDDLGVRGDSCYSQIFGLLDQIDGYVDAVVIAARMAAVFGLIIKETSAPKQFAGLNTAVNSKGDQQKALTLENGMLKFMGVDGDVVQVQAQQPMNQTPDFIRAMCRLLGLPFDMPLELVCKDMSQVNFASARIGLIGYYRACRARQKAFVARCLSRIYQWWISRQVKMGLIQGAPTKFWAHKFMAEGWDYTDPVSEAQADLLQIDMGIKTPQMSAAERGRDFEEMQLEIRAAKALRRMNELPEIGSTFTRDRVELAADPNTPDPALEKIKGEADAYGVAVRAGVITPQTADEESFRTKMELPAMSKEAKTAWSEDKGVRRPITLTPPVPVAPLNQDGNNV